jgi:hypothetical protein
MPHLPELFEQFFTLDTDLVIVQLHFHDGLVQLETRSDTVAQIRL